MCLLQELADADLVHDVGAELLTILSLNLRAECAVPRGEFLHNRLNMRTLASGRGCEGVGQGLLVDLGGEHRPRPVLLVSDPHDAVWEGIRGGVIQLLQQVLQVCGQKRFGNCLPIVGRSIVVTFGGGWLGLSLPLLLKHEVNAAELLRAVYLIEKLPIHSQVILGTVEVVFKSTNHFGTDSVVRGGLP